MEIVIVIGNIVEADADVVVVSANASLRSEGRAGAALVAHGGDGITAALEERARRGGVGLGDVVYTGAGRHARIATIAWAVIRDYRFERPDVGDEDAVRLAGDTLWRTIVEAAPSAAPLNVAIVPLGAVELGIERSGTILAATLAARPEVHGRLGRVAFIAAHPRDTVAFARGVRSSFADACFGPLRPVPKPPPAPPPPPRPVRAPKDRNGDSVVIDAFDRTAHLAPVGSGGVLFRVRRRDMPGAFAFDIEAQEALEQIAIDSVPAGERVMLLDGEHVLTGHLRTTEPACVVVRICGVEAHTCSVGRFTTSEPLGGWRDPAYNDQSWPSLRWSAQAPRGLVPAEPLEDDCPLWLRLRFSTRLGRPQ